MTVSDAAHSSRKKTTLPIYAPQGASSLLDWLSCFAHRRRCFRRRCLARSGAVVIFCSDDCSSNDDEQYKLFRLAAKNYVQEGHVVFFLTPPIKVVPRDK